jgi:heme A synthase
VIIMQKRILCALLVALLCSSAFAWKKEAHFISLPLIEGCGIYSSVRMLQESHSSNTKASAITSLGLLGTNAAIGCVAVFGPHTNYMKLRQIHRYVGFALTAAAIWMSVSAGNDAHVQNPDRNIAYGYALLTSIPLILFSF